MQSVTVLFGKPGAGKGTRLSEFLETTDKEFKILSVGNLLRQARSERTELGKKAATYMDAGLLVPDDIINEIVIDGICESSEPIISDGFPRTIGQAQAMLEAGIKPTVVDFYVDDDVVLERAQNRIVCENCGEPYTTNEFKHPKVDGICDKCGGHLCKRSDDSPEVTKNRLDVYKRETLPVLNLFKENHVNVYTINNDNKSEDAKIQFAKLMVE